MTCKCLTHGAAKVQKNTAINVLCLHYPGQSEEQNQKELWKFFVKRNGRERLGDTYTCVVAPGLCKVWKGGGVGEVERRWEYKLKTV